MERKVEQTSRTPSGTENTNNSAPNTSASKESSNSIAWGITIISSITLILTLLGYGVSMAVESMFAIPHQSVYSSPLDLIGLSFYAIVPAVLGVGKIAWQPILALAWQPALIVATGLLLFSCLLIYLKKRHERANNNPNLFSRYFSPPKKSDSTGRLLGKATIGSVFVGGLVFVTPFLMAGAFVGAIILISIVPMFGMQLGAEYFRKFVVTPIQCEPVKSRSNLMDKWAAPEKKSTSTASTANCVALLKDGKRLANGRVIVSTPTSTVLFEPDSGLTWRVPIGDLIVLPIDAIPTSSQQEPK